jgi:hypothetical protein
MTGTLMLWEVQYTVLANGWQAKRTMTAATEEDALEQFREYWTRDGSSLDELADYYIVGGPMGIEA